jgi:hypothetical protein
MRTLALLGAVLSASIAVPIVARAESAPRLLALPGTAFAWEKAGPMALLRCPRKWDDCGEFESLSPQLTPDWDGLLAKARAKVFKKEPDAGTVLAEAVEVDQFGGAWKVRLLAAGADSVVPKITAPYAVEIRPGFPGYRLSGSGRDMKVDALADAKQWEEARQELGLGKREKRGLGALFGE